MPITISDASGFEWQNDKERAPEPSQCFSIDRYPDGNIELYISRRYSTERDDRIAVAMVSAEEAADFILTLQTWIEQLPKEAP